MIRQVMPGLIANEIASVQPMTGSVGQIFSMKNTLDNEFILHKIYPSIISNMKIAHISIRPFMRKGDAEPNEHYRPWLEENIGQQGVSWNWKIHSVNGNLLAIDFATEEHAILFELKWP